MATLWERLVGINLPNTAPPVLDEQKIGIHSFTGGVEELTRGYFSAADMIAIHNLNAAQVSDAARIKGLIEDAPDKDGFMRIFKSLLYMGETKDAYLIEVDFWARAEAIVTDQGGTVT